MDTTRLYLYDSKHQCICCPSCDTCIKPTKEGIDRHYRNDSHDLSAVIIKALTIKILQLPLSGFDTFYSQTKTGLPPNVLRMRDVNSMPLYPPIAGKSTCRGFYCSVVVDGKMCGVAFKHTKDLTKHAKAIHRIDIRSEEMLKDLCIECHIQTYSEANQYRCYFPVTVAQEKGDAVVDSIGNEMTSYVNMVDENEHIDLNEASGSNKSVSLKPNKSDAHDVKPTNLGSGHSGKDTVNDGETEPGHGANLVSTDSSLSRFLRQQRMVLSDIERESANRIHALGESLAERIPWLLKTGFPQHLNGLHDSQIKKAISFAKHRSPVIPFSTTDYVYVDSVEDDVSRLVEIMESGLYETYMRCSAENPKTQYSRPRADILGTISPTAKVSSWDPYKHPASLAKYFKTWKGLIGYSWRCMFYLDSTFPELTDRMDGPKEIQFTTQQQTSMRNIQELLRLPNTHDRSSISQIRDELLLLSIALIQHRIGSEVYKSPIISYCAMLSRSQLRKEDHVIAPAVATAAHFWSEPQNYNTNLSALLWVAQLVVLDTVVGNCKKANNGDDVEVIPNLKRFCSTYMTNQCETPYGTMLLWRVYLFQVMKNTVSQRQAQWNATGDIITFGKVQLPMPSVCSLIHNEYVLARQLLAKDLMFGVESRVASNSALLWDDMELSVPYKSWTHVLRNQDIVRDADIQLSYHVLSDVKLRKRFGPVAMLGEDRGDTAQMELQHEIYEQKVQMFLKHLAVVVHLSAGQPLREPELLSIMWQNSPNERRHIWIQYGKVMIRTFYHKGQQHSGTSKENVRFLPSPVGNLVLDFIAYVQPFRQFLLHQRHPTALLSSHLWSYADGKQGSWASGRLTGILYKACNRSGICKFNVSQWRQISAAICKEKFSGISGFDTVDEVGEEDDDDIAVDIGEEKMGAFAEQGNHSVQVFNRSYAGSNTLVMSNVMNRGFHASRLWSEFLGLDALFKDSKRSRSLSSSSENLWHLNKRHKFQLNRHYTLTELRDSVRRLLKDDKFSFRQDGQAKALSSLVGKDPKEQVVVIASTGHGKSYIYLAPAAMPEAQVTIVVLPLVVLRTELARKCESLGVSVHEWSADIPIEKQEAAVVVVTVEAAVTGKFMAYAHRLQARGRLDRIVVDECHLMVTANDYRKDMNDLGIALRSIRTQTLWLTATLPPQLVDEFTKQACLERPLIVRFPTVRHNIIYQNLVLRSGHDDFLSWCTDKFNRKWEKMNQIETCMGTQSKAIIYCTTKRDAHRVSRMLECPAFTADSGDATERAAILSAWIADETCPVIAATGALGVGFDYANVRLVMHFGNPRRLTDFAQESGRAGRNGLRSYSVLYTTRIPAEGFSRAEKQSSSHDEQAMILYLTGSHCLKGTLSQYLDAPSSWMWCTNEETRCTVCKSRRNFGEIRPKFVRFTFENTTCGGTSQLEDYVTDEAIQILNANNIQLPSQSAITSSQHTSVAPSSTSVLQASIHSTPPLFQVPKRPVLAPRRVTQDAGSSQSVPRTPQSSLHFVSTQQTPTHYPTFTTASLYNKSGMVESIPSSSSLGSYTGPDVVGRRQQATQAEQDEYIRLCTWAYSFCVYCRFLNLGDISHPASQCPHSVTWEAQKSLIDEASVEQAVGTHQQRLVNRKKAWVDQPFSCCFYCFHPLFWCTRNNAQVDASKRLATCPLGVTRFMFPFLIAVYEMPNGRSILKSQFGLEWGSIIEYGLWCGKRQRFANDKGMNAHHVVMKILSMVERSEKSVSVDNEE